MYNNPNGGWGGGPYNYPPDYGCPPPPYNPGFGFEGYNGSGCGRPRFRKENVLEAACFVADRARMTVRVHKHHHMGRNMAAAVPAATLVGGLMDGFAGMAIGGMVGAIGAGVASKSKYTPASELIRFMLPPYSLEQLSSEIISGLSHLPGYHAWPCLVQAATSDVLVESAIHQILKNFFEIHLGMKVKH